MKKWAMWNNGTEQRILNLDGGNYFLWEVGSKRVSFEIPGAPGRSLIVDHDTPELAAKAWEGIKDLLFTDAGE